MPRWLHRGVRAGWAGALLAAVRLCRAVRHFNPLVDAIARRLVFTPTDPQQAIRHGQRNFLSTEAHALAGTALATVSENSSLL